MSAESKSCIHSFTRRVLSPTMCQALGVQQMINTEPTPKKDVLFIIGNWNANVGIQEIPIWSNRHVWPWSTKLGRAKANCVLSREHTGHSKHALPITKEMTLYMDITRWSIPKSHWLYFLQLKMEKFYTVSQKKKNGLWLRTWASYCKIQAQTEQSRENH